MCNYLRRSPGPYLSIAVWLVFAVVLAVLIMGGDSIDKIVFGR